MPPRATDALSSSKPFRPLANRTASYETLTAAIRARQWCRTFRAKHARRPTVEERVAMIARSFGANVDVVYVNQACEGIGK